MENLITYVQKYGNLSLEDLTFGELDIVVLTEIVYFHFEDGDIPAAIDESQQSTIAWVWNFVNQTVEERTKQNPWVMTEERIALFQLVATSKRYEKLHMFGFVNEVNRELTKQFAAVTFQLSTNLRLIVYRGTDETLVGWKEDFMMTYAPTIPAQEAAAEYLKKQMDIVNDDFILSGHSKGGNLAMYAAAAQQKAVQQRIQKVYGWDAPGLHHSIVESVGYQEMIPKAVRYIPQDSIVGVMLESSVPYKIVYSTARGAAQHNVLTWAVEDHHFVEVPELTRNSKITDQAFKQWTKSITDEEFRIFWDSFFELLFDMGLTTLNDVEGQYISYVQKFMTYANQMDPEKRELLIRVASSLLQQSYLIWRETVTIKVTPPDLKLPSVEEIVRKMQQQGENFSVQYEKTKENEAIRKYYHLRHIQKRLEQANKEKTVLESSKLNQMDSDD